LNVAFQLEQSVALTFGALHRVSWISGSVPCLDLLHILGGCCVLDLSYQQGGVHREIVKKPRPGFFGDAVVLWSEHCSGTLW